MDDEQKISKSEFSAKKGFEQRYKALLGDRYEEFIKYSGSYIRKSIRINTLKAPLKKTKQSLEKNWRLEQIPWCNNGFWIEYKNKKRYDIGNTPEHFLGQIYVQESASMIPPMALKPMPGELVLDMCSAPGSKASQMADMMNNKGLLIASDVQAGRLKPLDINLQRTGVSNCFIARMPGRWYQKTSLRFDKVLVDAPCSGTGTIRRSFKTLKMWSPGMVKKLSSQQKQLIESGFNVLKPGGAMVYSTCTMEPEENEEVVDWLLNKHDDARLEKIKLNLKSSPAIKNFERKEYSHEISKCLRLWPQDNDSEGFFVARVIKGL